MNKYLKLLIINLINRKAKKLLLNLNIFILIISIIKKNRLTNLYYVLSCFGKTYLEDWYLPHDPDFSFLASSQVKIIIGKKDWKKRLEKNKF